MDDNAEILELLNKRLQFGKDKYGHGVIIDQNTKDFGTKDNDWELMALEEMLDGLIYTTASIIRYKRKEISDQFDSKKIMSFFNKVMNKYNTLYNENKLLKEELEKLKNV